jgi:hypothetical protein
MFVCPDSGFGFLPSFFLWGNWRLRYFDKIKSVNLFQNSRNLNGYISYI